VEIRPTVRGDVPQIEALVAAAFDESSGGRVVTMLRALEVSLAVRAGLVAVDDGQIVGHTQLNRCWVDARPALVEVLVLSPLSVAPERQRAGIGTALVAAALDEARRLAAPAVFLEGDWTYYGPRGFRAAVPAGFRPPSRRIPGPAFQVALLPAHEPWMVGTLVYCEAFWSTDTVGLRDPRLAEVEQQVAEPVDAANRGADRTNS
jgi:putative acetyltransferase